MVKLNFVFVCIIFLFSTFGYSQKVALESNKKNVRVGESIQITITYDIDGNLNIETPDEFQFGGFSSSQSSSSWINGKQTVKYIIERNGYFTLPGTYQLGPVIIANRKKNYQSNTIELKVIGETNQNESLEEEAEKPVDKNLSNLLLRKNFVGLIDFQKNSIYQGEALLIQGKVISGTNFELYSYEKQYTVKGNNESYNIGTIGELEKELIDNNGRKYLSVGFDKKVFFFNESGNYHFNPFSINASYGGFYSEKIISEKKNIEVKPLPSNKPKDFTGVVGNLKLKSENNIFSPKKGETYTIHLALEGNGNIHQSIAPKLNCLKGWELASPTDFSSKYVFDESGANGVLEYDYFVTCTEENPSSLGPVTLSYFDPAREEFIQLTTDTIYKSTVKNSNQNPIENEVSNLLNEKENQPQQGSNKNDERTNVSEDYDKSILNNPLLWMAIGGIVALALLIGFLSKPRFFSRINNPRKNRKLNRKNIRQLHKDSKLLLKSGDFLPAISKMEECVFQAICFKLGLEYASANQGEIMDKLEKNKKYSAILPDVHHLVEVAQEFRYGSMQEGEMPKRLMNETEKILNFFKIS